MRPNWYSLPDYLAEQFPHLRAEIEETYFSLLTVSDNPYPHPFIEEYLGTILCGQRKDATDAERVRAGQLLEELLTSGDEDLVSAALTSIVEVLRDEPALRLAASPYLGPTALKWLEQLVK